MKEIYCSAGKLSVQLPDQAWSKSSHGVSRHPCPECHQDSHLQNKELIQQSLNKSYDVGIKSYAVLNHQIQVVENPTSDNTCNLIICRCLCREHFPSQS